MVNLITVPLAASDVDWNNWGLPMTNAVNDHEQRISSFETGTVGQVVARHCRATFTTAATGTEAGIFWLGFSALEGHLYSVEILNFGVYGTTAGDVLQTSLRYTTDGSTPIPTSSPQATGSYSLIYNPSSSGYVLTHTCAGLIYAEADSTIKVMFTQRRTVGSGTIGVYTAGGTDTAICMNVFDNGFDPGCTGTDI